MAETLIRIYDVTEGEKALLQTVTDYETTIPIIGDGVAISGQMRTVVARHFIELTTDRIIVNLLTEHSRP